MRFEDRSEAGRWLQERLAGWVGDAVVVVLDEGGAEVAEALVEPGQEVHRVDRLADLAGLPHAPGTLLLVDDGEKPPEELACAAWAALCLAPRELVVATPLASRWLEAALPPRAKVHAARRYTPRREDLFVYGADERSWEADFEPRPVEPRPRRERPPRTGKPWEREEEQRLEALVRAGTPLPEIATALGRTQNGVASRLGRIAVQVGAFAPAPGPERPVDPLPPPVG